MTRASLLQVIAQEASRFKVKPQDVFSATTYKGNATTRTVSNGLDLSAAGSLMWGSPRIYIAIRKSI